MSEVFGIDVSHHQSTIDWKKVAKSGIKFAIMKCQYEAASHRIDEQFESNYDGAGKYGIKRGVYIYIARASMADIDGDVKSLLKHLNGRKLEYGIWLDLEDASVATTGKDFIRNMSYRYAKALRNAGYYVGIYCNRDWYLRLIHDDLKQDFDFWIARYPKNDNGKYNPNSSLKPSEDIAVAWQYSSKGKVDGISGNVDLDVDYDGNIDLIFKGEKTAENTQQCPYDYPAITIRFTMQGNEVKWLQWQLNRHGANLKVDGIFGDKTLEAVRQFQIDKKLVVDGIVGKQTKSALKL